MILLYLFKQAILLPVSVGIILVTLAILFINALYEYADGVDYTIERNRIFGRLVGFLLLCLAGLGVITTICAIIGILGNNPLMFFVGISGIAIAAWGLKDYF